MLATIYSWFLNHGKARPPRQRMSEYVIPGTGLRFLWYAALEADEYPTVWGYSVNGGLLSCRHFYRSASEAAWRAGTGFRDNGSWVKSAEDMPGHQSSGYVFEGILPQCLDQELTRYFKANRATPKSSYRCPDGRRRDWSVILADPQYDATALVGTGLTTDNLRPLRDYLIETGIARNLGHIQRLYHAERQYQSVLPEAVLEDLTDYYESIKTGHDDPTQIGWSQKMAKRAVKVSNVTLQDTYGTGVDARGRAVRTGHGHMLKARQPLWTWLCECLDQEQAPPVTGLQHDILGMSFGYRSYRLAVAADRGLCLVEIARTRDAVSSSYVSPGGVRLAATTPICWIRSVNLPNGGFTSFGTFTRIPIDLAFLVQKPCDYLGQTSPAVADLLGVATEPGQGGRRMFTAPDPDRLRSGEEHIFFKGERDERGTYLGLSILNETTSPLLKAYKKREGLQTFRYKYNTLLQTWLDHARVREAARRGVAEYLDIHQVQGSRGESGHGEKGVRRATDFQRRIDTAGYDSSRIFADLYDLFMNNKVANGQGGYHTYWFAGINTKPLSLFTIVILHILRQFIDDGGHDRLAEYPKVAGKTTYVGSRYCVHRVLVKAIALCQRKPANRPVADWLIAHSADLLKAMK